MALTKKFGTFSGVFTPSILTILGVIMYLRLPWIVGQAGLWNTLGIIVVAHIISVTTGLSVASIATDKKVKTGGNYYIISRSLGLPIGGTLGLALFAGLSFSVSLYIIGFIESFLPAVGIETTISNIRIFGTLAVLMVTTIVLVSTSLALKIQYFILAAIVLSLVSVFFGNVGFVPEKPLFEAAPNSASLMVLFGIFFPAVTGFTAGVQMSGDLKDPKKSIPVGTVASIAVGFVIYVGLAVFLAFRVNAQELIANPNILGDMALVPAFLLAGIWGATLSSAMGSLLGAPRILQATSMDQISPRIFAKGHGPSNEPRNALLLTFMIAEVGILIGELNLIAAIISTFFITTYGFINLSCAIENWASPDFRPSFRIPTWVSLLGAAASFLVMIELDLLSFVGATLILGVLYLHLKRKELTLDTGDTWEGIWSSLIRTALHRLSNIVGQTRNWRPNIILFSGGESRRHLIEFGEWIVRRKGILFNFDLKENREGKLLFPKTGQSVHNVQETVHGIFSRQLECRDIYDGMESISQVFGISGVEPNTIMLGWARNSRDPQRFAEMIQRFTALDYNLLFLDYDQTLGFGEKRRIDIWWRGGSSNATLELAILKYLRASEEWQGASARILIPVEESSQVKRVLKNMTRILEEQRIDAELKVINNTLEKKSYPELVKAESQEADLIMMGMPHLDNQNTREYMDNVDAIVADLGSVLLVHASAFFKPLHIGIEDGGPVRTADETTAQFDPYRDLPSLILPRSAGTGTEGYERLSHWLQQIDLSTGAALLSFSAETAGSAMATLDELVDELDHLIDRSLSTLVKKGEEGISPRFRKFFTKTESDCLYQFKRLLDAFNTNTVQACKLDLETGTEHLHEQIKNIIDSLPDRVTVYHDPAALESIEEDSISLRFLKWRKRTRHRVFKKAVMVNYPISRRVSHFLNLSLQQSVVSYLENFGSGSYQQIMDIQKWFNQVSDAFQLIRGTITEGQSPETVIEQERAKLTTGLAEIRRQSHIRRNSDLLQLLMDSRANIQTICEESVLPDASGFVRRKYGIPRMAARISEKLNGIPATWGDNITLVTNYTLMEVNLMIFRSRVNTIIQKHTTDLQAGIENNILTDLRDLETVMQSCADDLDLDSGQPPITYQYRNLLETDGMIRKLDEDVLAAVYSLPESIDIVSEESFRDLEIRQYDGVETITVSLRRLVSYLMASNLMEPLQKRYTDLPQQFADSRNIIEDVIRLVQFNQEIPAEPEEADEDGPVETQSQIIHNGIVRVTREREKMSQIPEELNGFIMDCLAGAYGKLNPYVITRTAGNLGQYIRTHESRRMFSEVSHTGRRLQQRISELVTGLIYRQSRGVLFARRLRESDQPPVGSIEVQLALVESVTPTSDVTTALPIYYRQLFTGKQPIGSEFRVGHGAELKKAEQAVKRYRQGYRGGILIVGEPNSGKSTLCRTIAQMHFEDQRIFRLTPPEGGCIDIARFRTLLGKALGYSRDPDGSFSLIPSDSILILHDLELWWERSRDGFAVIDEIIQLIDRISDRCLVLAETSSHSFQFMNHVKPVDKAFIGIIECGPLDARELQEAIRLRHRSSGLILRYKEREESQIAGYIWARLFSDYFDYSKGNIGTALQAWVSNINRYVSETIHISAPVKPDLFALDLVQEEWKVWLCQFIVHKHLSVERLGRLFQVEDVVVTSMVQNLLRSGLVIENKSGLLKLNPYLRLFITQKFSDLERI